jgi:hypothetical protein
LQNSPLGRGSADHDVETDVKLLFRQHQLADG